MYKQRDIIIIPIPFTDLSSNKKRPVVIISNNNYTYRVGGTGAELGRKGGVRGVDRRAVGGRSSPAGVRGPETGDRRLEAGGWQPEEWRRVACPSTPLRTGGLGLVGDRERRR